MESHFLSLLMVQFLPQLPLCLVWLVGTILALVGWRKHPMPSLLALIAFVLLLLQSLVGTVAYVGIFSQTEVTSDQLRLLLPVLSGVRTIVSTVAWGLLLGALFGWRKQVARGPRAEEGYATEVLPERGIQEGRSH
jgi:hypothetical protein